MKKIIVLTMLVLSALGFAKEVNIKILGTSDVHGHIVPWNYQTDEFDDSGSYSQIAKMVDGYRKGNKNVILVDAGDIIQDNLIERFINEPRHPAMLVLNQMGYDVMVPGNHEFNFGMPALDNVLKQFKGKALAANIYYDNGANYLPASTIITKEGVKIGIIGVTTPLTEKFEENTGNVKGMKFTMPIPELKNQVNSLRGRVDAIVVVAHMGLPNENNIPGTGVIDIANEVPGIDVIIAGHFHKDVSKETVNGVLITEPYKYGMSLSVVDLKFNVEKGSVSLINKDSRTLSVKGEDSEQGIEVIYNPFHQKLREEVNQVIGETANNMVPEGKIKGIPYAFASDTGLSSLITATELYYSKADVVSFSYDTENVKLEKGPIRRKDIYANYRYAGGEVTVYEMTGRDLKDYMEWSAGYFDTIRSGDTEYKYNAERRNFKYVTYDIFGGVRYKIDLKVAPGSRIRDLTLVSSYKRITDNMKVRVGMNSYRYEMLVQKGGPLEGRNIKKVWDSKEAMGQEKGTIQNMVINYIVDVRKGKVTGLSNNYWSITGLR